MFSLTICDVRNLTYQFPVKLPNPFDKKKGKPGKDWLHGFMKRRPELSLRQPEATSADKIMSFNLAYINKLFDYEIRNGQIPLSIPTY